MAIGNAKYQCACVRYPMSQDNTILIVGLTVGVVVLLVLIIIIIIVAVKCCSRQGKQAQQRAPRYNDNTAMEEEHYARKLADYEVKNSRV